MPKYIHRFVVSSNKNPLIIEKISGFLCISRFSYYLHLLCVNHYLDTGIINSIGGGGGGGGGRGGNIGNIIGTLIGGGGGGGQYNGGGGLNSLRGYIIYFSSNTRFNKFFPGGNISPNRLNGGMVNIIGHLIGEAAHRFLGVDPATGRIIGALCFYFFLEATVIPLTKGFRSCCW